MSDLVVGGIFFIVLLTVAVVAGGLLQGSASTRNRRALTPLAPIIAGSVQSDHQTAWMDGQYGHQPVRVMITPGRNVSDSSEYTIRLNSLDITVPGVRGAHSWAITQQGLLKKQWVVETASDQVKHALAGTDLTARLQAAGRRQTLRYDASANSLHFHEDVAPRRAPAAESLRARLDLLVYAARINAQVNPDARG